MQPFLRPLLCQRHSQPAGLDLLQVPLAHRCEENDASQVQPLARSRIDQNLWHHVVPDLLDQRVQQNPEAPNGPQRSSKRILAAW
eukprot:9473702-Pyramimonas_sp.AAC.1